MRRSPRRYVNGSWQDGLSLAAADDARRKAAVDETMATLDVAAAVPYKVLVVHCGVPEPYAGPGDNSRSSLIRSLEELSPVAARYGVRLAIEVIPNELSTPSALVDVIESDIDAAGLGICMDVGHARMMGDVVDAIETCSGHLVTTHLHDNRGRSDDHLVPGKGVIDWDATHAGVSEGRLRRRLDVRARRRRGAQADPRAGRESARTA